MSQQLTLIFGVVLPLTFVTINGMAAERPTPATLCGVNNCVFSPKGGPPLRNPPALQHVGPPVIVSYTAFDGTNYTMKEFYGKNTSILIKLADLPVFSEAQAWELVDQADYLYETFKELLGVEPQGSGRLRIAFVDTCGGGCGYVGSKGIELGPYFANGGAWFASGDLPDLYPYMAHEMTHNFDRWSSYIMFGSDTAHAWTSFMDAYIVVANQQGHAPDSGGQGYNPADFLKKRVDESFGPFLAASGSTWPSCVRDAACSNLNATQIQGGFAAQLAQLLGPTAVRQAMAELKDAATTRGLNPSTMTPEQKNDLLIECFSRGARTNLSCLMSPLHWRIGAALQSQLTALYGSNHYACVDADGDGYTPLQGDNNDSLSSVHPGATEIVNGVDDDCDGIVDDIHYNETTDFPNTLSSALSIAFPFKIAGSIASTSDEDYFKIALATAAKVRFSLKSGGTFAGWLFIYDAGGNWLTYLYCGAGSQSDLDVSLPAGTWRFSVSQNVSSSPGSYQLTGVVPTVWPIYLYPGPPSLAGTNLWRFVSSIAPTNLVGLPDVQARLWVSGFGWVSTNILGASNFTTFTWSASSNLPPSETTFRVQFYQATNPVVRATESLPFTGIIPASFSIISNTTLNLSWSAASAGISITSATNLIGPWLAVTNTPSFTNGLFTVRLPAGNARALFLKLQ